MYFELWLFPYIILWNDNYEGGCVGYLTIYCSTPVPVRSGPPSNCQFTKSELLCWVTWITPKFKFQWTIYRFSTTGALMRASVTLGVWGKTIVPGRMIIGKAAFESKVWLLENKKGWEALKVKQAEEQTWEENFRRLHKMFCVALAILESYNLWMMSWC